MQGLTHWLTLVLVAAVLTISWQFWKDDQIVAEPITVDENQEQVVAEQYLFSTVVSSVSVSEGFTAFSSSSSSDTEEHQNSSLAAYLLEVQALHKAAECEWITRYDNSSEPHPYELSLVEHGVGNDEYREWDEHQEELRAECPAILGDANYRSTYDLAMELDEAGNDDGLFYLATFALPSDFGAYDEMQKADYRKSLGRLIEERMFACNRGALVIYAASLGLEVGWSLDEGDLSESAIAHKREQINSISKQLIKPPIVRPPANDELESTLRWAEVKRIEQELNQIVEACNRKLTVTRDDFAHQSGD